MEKDLISVIIPVYNVKDYVRRCIESVMHQTYENLQILVINDGSTDSSEELCRQLASKDFRMTVISTKNQGVSAARNEGLLRATGKYVCFVDSDDYIDSEMIEQLVTDLKENDTELAICGFREGEEGSLVDMTAGKKQIYTSQEAKRLVFANDLFRGFLWNKLFVKRIIDEHQLTFHRQLKVWEDLLFVFQYLHYINRLVYNPTPFYNYIFRKSSASHKFNMDNTLNVVEAQELMMQSLSKDEVGIREALAGRILTSCLDIYRAAAYNYGNYQNYRQIARKFLKQYQKIGEKGLNKKDRVFVQWVLVNPYTFCLIYEKTHKEHLRDYSKKEV